MGPDVCSHRPEPSVGCRVSGGSYPAPMDRLTLALTVAFIVIGTVLAGVWALARLGSRAMLHPPSPRTSVASEWPWQRSVP